MSTPRSIPTIVAQHAEDAGTLQHVRARLAAAHRAGVEQLSDVDERIDAHIDALTVAGEIGWRAAEKYLGADDGVSQFPACALALESRNAARLDRCLAVAEATPAAYDAMLSACGWVSSSCLQGTVASLLGSASTTRRRLGLQVCALRRINPGATWIDRLKADPDPSLRAVILRMAGELGEHQLLDAVTSGTPSDRANEFWAAWSSVMLGDRGRFAEYLMRECLDSGAHRIQALTLAVQALQQSVVHEFLQALAAQSSRSPLLILGSGVAGDVAYVPWLIRQMAIRRLARIAGDAFTMITGADLQVLHLDSEHPQSPDEGAPSDDPEDPNVEMHPDDGLPWPDAKRIEGWWAANANRFEPGLRYFLGAPVTREHCVGILKTGYQRQRLLAAQYLCLLEPGTPLFNTSAPAWRQQRLMAKMQ